MKEKWGFNPNESFFVDENVRKLLDHTERGNTVESEWNKMFDLYTQKYPEIAQDLVRRMSGELPEGWRNVLPSFKPSDKQDATRNISGNVLRSLAKVIPEIMGGSADLNPSYFYFIF